MLRSVGWNGAHETIRSLHVSKKPRVLRGQFIAAL